METKRMLLINRSPRKKGTSYSFSRTIESLSPDWNYTAEIVHSIDYFDGRKDIGHLKGLIEQSGIIGMVAPLYADTLPYPDIQLLERLAAECGKELKGKGFFAIGQCGFPDITRIEPLLDSCRFFALETGMNWLGGLAYGGGAMLNGAHLEELGKKGEKIISGFRLALDSIFKGEQIPAEAQKLITIKIPKLLYRPLAAYLNNNARKQARENGNIDYKRKVYLE